jgi:hypothetical protein
VPPQRPRRPRRPPRLTEGWYSLKFDQQRQLGVYVRHLSPPQRRTLACSIARSPGEEEDSFIFPIRRDWLRLRSQTLTFKDRKLAADYAGWLTRLAQEHGLSLWP